jgi:hypothetical protein
VVAPRFLPLEAASLSRPPVEPVRPRRGDLRAALEPCLTAQGRDSDDETLSGCHDPAMVGVPVRVHSRTGDDLGVCHVPPPVELGDVLELGHGPPLRDVTVLWTPPGSPVVSLTARPAALAIAARY